MRYGVFSGCLNGSWPGSGPAGFRLSPLLSGGHRLDERSEDFIYRIRSPEDCRHVTVKHNDNSIFSGLAGEAVWLGLSIIKSILGPQFSYEGNICLRCTDFFHSRPVPDSSPGVR
jgi:hypothetical protein